MMLSYLIISVIGFGIVFFWVTQIVETFLINQRLGEQLTQLNRIADRLTPLYLDNDGDGLYRVAMDSVDTQNHRLLVLDRQGVVQIDTGLQYLGTRQEIDEIAGVLADGNYDVQAFHKFPGTPPADAGWLDRLWARISQPEDWWVYSVRAIDHDGQIVGAVLFSSHFHDVMDEIDRIRAQMTLILVIVLLSMLLASLLLARSITKPIVELTQIIRRMGRGEFKLRVAVHGKGEFAELGRTFNDMSERLENTERFRSEFISNASHEIKTPLATMKILIESLLYQEHFDENVARDFLGDVNQEIDRLNVVISDLLHLVQVDKHAAELRPERSDLKAICADVLHRLQPIAKKRGVTLEGSLESAPLYADPIKLNQAIFNLTDNAIKYSDAGGHVRVSCHREGQEAIAIIADDGIGIPEADQAHVFDRFYRVDKARSRQTGGTGLGLSIVDGVVKLHNGRIELVSAEGEGSTFTLRLPVGDKKHERGDARGE